MQEMSRWNYPPSVEIFTVLQKAIVAQGVKKISAFCGTRIVVTAATGAHQLILS
jgi:hypothetical protein